MATVIKVSSRSSPHSVAGALAGIIRESGTVEVQVIGAGALNQAVKSIAIARHFLAAGGQDASCWPTFASVDLEGERRTAIRLLVRGEDGDAAGRSVPSIDEVVLEVHADPAVPAPGFSVSGAAED